jgi:predicted ester cyclase
MGISPTGKQGKTTLIDIIRIVDGKMVERWGKMDMLGLMQQLGVTPLT